MKDSYKAISLFCGCGGSDLGLVGGFSYLGQTYKKTGVVILHSSDINEKAVQTYNHVYNVKKWFNHTAQIIDVKNLSFPKGVADVVIGGFPCQSFSTVNPTKRPENRKNQLFWELARIVGQIQPSVFVGENVKGFFTLHGGKYFSQAKNEFERLGYNVSYKIINASEYGIPQRRERLFMVGVKRKLKITFQFPESVCGEAPLKPLVPLKAVIDSLTPPHEKYYFSQRAVEGVKKAKPNMKRALAQDLTQPCLTITSHLAKVSLNSRDPVLLVNAKKELYRRFTPREAARIQSFPDDFCFAGSEADAYRQIGNAIPPVAMWHLTKAIVEQVFKTKSVYFEKPQSRIAREQSFELVGAV